jgi:hypothetical protein
MALPPDVPLPQPSYSWVQVGGRPTQPFAQYMAKFDACVRALAGGLFGAPVQLTNAANDAAAAAAGVPIGGLYRNGSAVNVRVT